MWVCFCSLASGHLLFLAQFVEEVLFFSILCFCIFVKYKVAEIIHTTHVWVLDFVALIYIVFYYDSAIYLKICICQDTGYGTSVRSGRLERHMDGEHQRHSLITLDSGEGCQSAWLWHRRDL